MLGQKTKSCGSPDCKRKYNAARAHRYEPTCRRCGNTFAATRPGAKWCSAECRPQDARKARRLRARVENLAKRAAQGTSGRNVFIVDGGGLVVEAVAPAEYWGEMQKSPLRRAHDLGDGDGVIAALLADTRAQGECRMWTRSITDDGYAKVKLGRRTVSVHRLVAEAVHGPLDGMAIHHTCANRACVAPNHLQPVTQYDNAAEMLERNWYLKRIALLEEALASVVADHPLLKVRAHKASPAAA
jgi:hypothetical protein